MVTLLDDLAKTFEATPEQIHGDVEAFIKGFADKRVIDL
jgi:hypothetical protein